VLADDLAWPPQRVTADEPAVGWNKLRSVDTPPAAGIHTGESTSRSDRDARTFTLADASRSREFRL
jgi:hypothetical protein